MIETFKEEKILIKITDEDGVKVMHKFLWFPYNWSLFCILKIASIVVTPLGGYDFITHCGFVELYKIFKIFNFITGM